MACRCSSGQVTVPQNVKFTPENFGTARRSGRIGTPNRSAQRIHERPHRRGRGSAAILGLLRFLGRGAGAGQPRDMSSITRPTRWHRSAATNDPNAWIANQWHTFDPGLYDSANDTTDNYNNTAPAYVTAARRAGELSRLALAGSLHRHRQPGCSGTVRRPSVALVALKASLVVALNGHSETWSFNNFPPRRPDGTQRRRRILSVGGLPISQSDLNAAGADRRVHLQPQRPRRRRDVRCAAHGDHQHFRQPDV